MNLMSFTSHHSAANLDFSFETSATRGEIRLPPALRTGETNALLLQIPSLDPEQQDLRRANAEGVGTAELAATLRLLISSA
jgi:hypothetical protein